MDLGIAGKSALVIGGSDGLVTVNAVAPATFAKFHDPGACIAAKPLKRAGRPEELGSTVAFLASQQAGFITDQVIQLDGGSARSLV